MSSSFLKNFKNLVKKQYQCELTESIKMKQFLHKFKKEYEIKDPEILSRFPKKELKSFIKIECPTNTNDENLKAQEVQSSLKRLRALHGVKEDLVCQNCSKRDTCKVVNLVPEINEQSSKSQLSDLFTSLYYFAVEIESKNQNQVEKEQEDIEEEISQVKSGKDKKSKNSDKDKAEISLAKYRECQDLSSFYKNSTSANKLTDTMHLVLDDLYNNLGVETKKFNNEFIEEERRRRFMERIFKKLEREINDDTKLRKQEFVKKFGSSSSDQKEIEDNEDSEHPLTKKNQKFKNRYNRELDEEQTHQEDDEEDSNFVQVAGKSNKFNKKGLFDKIMDSNPEEGRQYAEMKRSYRNKNEGESDGEESGFKKSNKFEKTSNRFGDNKKSYDRENKTPYDRDNKRSYDRENKKPYERENRTPYEREYKKSFDRDNKKPYDRENKTPYDRDNKKPYDRENKRSYEREDKYSNRENKSEGREYGTKFNKENRYDLNKQKKDNFDDKYNSNSRNEGRFEKYGDKKDFNKNKSFDRFEKSGMRQQRSFDQKWEEGTSNKKQSYENLEQQESQKKPSFDRLQKINDDSFQKFMFKDSQEQKTKISQGLQQKHQQQEERKAQRFEQEVQKIQDIVKQESEDMLVREVDRKKQPRYSKGSFKFSKTLKKDD